MSKPMSSLCTIALVGPTASGKSAAALHLVQRLGQAGVPAEIISMDSALVYRGLDIGTAKPTAQERAAVPHHLIDIRDPSESYSAAQFVQDTQALVASMHARGVLPLVVGGTMLYWRALRQGLAPMPAANIPIRQAIEAEALERGWPALHAALAQVDPITAARLAPNDSQRIQRALEVFRSSGQSLAQWHAQSPAARDDPVNRHPVNLISLEPRDRRWLHERIAWRFDAMLAHGFLDEVRSLQARADLHADLPAMRSVGYRQAWQHLAVAAEADSRQGAALRDAVIAATRQLAKRQITWLRSMDERHVVPCDEPSDGVLDAVWTLAQRALRAPRAAAPAQLGITG